MAPFVAAGPSAYALYTYVQFVLVPDYSRYAGNNERDFFFYLVLIILGWTTLLAACRAIALNRPTVSARLGRTMGVAMLVVGIAFALAWIGSIARLSNPPLPAEYLEHPTGFRRSEWAARWAYSFIGMQTLLTCAVAGMAIRMALRDDPAVTPPLLVVSTTGAVAFLTLYIVALRGAVEFRRPRATSA